MTKRSGNSYIAALVRKPDTYADRLIQQIPTASVRFCRHEATICMTTDCIRSWSIDYELLWQRTGAGRKFADYLKA